MKKILAILSVSLVVFTARGDTIVFDTIGPTGSYTPFNGYVVSSLPQFQPQQIGAYFVAAASGNLSQIDLAVTYFDRVNGIPLSPGTVNVFLYGDNSNTPNNASQTFLGSVTPNALVGAPPTGLLSLSVLGNVSVFAGSSYWLVLKPADPVMGDLWNFSNPAHGISYIASSHDDSTWSTSSNAQAPAFRITAAVPDPGNTLVLLLGSVAILLSTRRHFFLS